MILKFAYSKIKTAQERYFTPASAITTFVDTKEATIHPLGGTGANAPSTLIVDGKGNQYTVAKAFSAVNAALTAVTADSEQVSLL